MKITDKYVLFWSGIYSQWDPCQFTIDGVTYNCCEQYMMAKKALLFKDKASYNAIMSTDNPKEQKAIGRKVKNFDTNLWNKFCREYVYEGNLAKFTQNPKLMDKLIKTGNREIVEGSPYDTIWGIGLKWDDPKALDKSQWQGSNWLGEAIMRVRDEIVNS